MSFITKNANLLLLLLIVISAFGLIGATVYFQANFSKINAEYDSKLAELQKVEKDLADQKKLLDQVSAELQLKSARETEIGSKYTEKVVENVELTEAKKELTQSVEQLSYDLQTTRTDNLRLEAENSNLQSELNDKQAEINRLEGIENLYEDLKREKIQLDAKISCLRSTDDSNEGTC